jgi:nucleotide-binding universal stress UspA family protein
MFARIVVGVAKTETARRATDVAVDLAERYGSTLHAVMALDRSATALDSEARTTAEAFLETIRSRTTAAVEPHAIPGDPADTLLMVAKEVDADLIVVGNRGMRGAGRVLGSVPNTIAHGASCSVMVVDTT